MSEIQTKEITVKDFVNKTLIEICDMLVPNPVIRESYKTLTGRIK